MNRGHDEMMSQMVIDSDLGGFLRYFEYIYIYPFGMKNGILVLLGVFIILCIYPG